MIDRYQRRLGQITKRSAQDLTPYIKGGESRTKRYLDARLSHFKSAGRKKREIRGHDKVFLRWLAEYHILDVGFSPTTSQESLSPAKRKKGT